MIGLRHLALGAALAAALGLALAGCAAGGGGDVYKSGAPVQTGSAPDFTNAEVQRVLAQAVSEAERLGANASVAVVTREGQIRGVFSMAASPAGPAFPGTAGVQPCDAAGVNCAVSKARTGAFFSSTGEAFSTLTAAFIVQNNFPPEVRNQPGGPLYGVQNSSLAGSDVLAAANGIMPNGITGVGGGFPLYKGGFPVGGVGISSDRPELDEAIALAAQKGFAPNPLILAEQILIDGIRLPYAEVAASNVPATRTFADLGAAVAGSFPFPVTAAPALVFPAATLGGVTGELRFPVIDSPSASAVKLLADDVRSILGNAAFRASDVRAAIRRPLGEGAKVFIAVVDAGGTILGVFRMRDATLFSFDVAVQKARTAVFFSSDAPGSVVETAGFRGLFGFPPAQPVAFTTRGIGFMAQGFYPPGIEGTAPGPLFGVQEMLGNRPFGNGITIFPGGIPLYKGGQLVGGIGVSGDGVDQDDIIADGGTRGFEPPAGVLKADQLFFGGARIPYVKHPRNPIGGAG